MSAQIDALRDAINADLAVINPQIDGLVSMSNDKIPQDAVQAVGDRLSRLQRRQGVDMTALDALDALDQDGFPTIPPSDVPQSVLDAINLDKSNVDAAAGGFEAAPVATTASAQVTVLDKP